MNVKVINFKASKRERLHTPSNGKWLKYGKDDKYPLYLLDVFHNKSNKHKAIISKKVDMTTGQGIETPTTTELTDFVRNKWSDSDLEEVLTRINYDYEIFNGFALLIKWSIDGSKIVEYDWLPFHKCRLSDCESFVYVSKDFTNVRKGENKPVIYKRFAPKETSEHKTQVFYFAELSNGIDFYPLPYYSSTLNWIELDGEISNFHLSGVKNGFTPSFMLNVATGIPTEEAMDEAHRNLEKKFAGSKNANKILVTFSEGKDQQPELTPIQLNDSDERFILLHKEMQTEIFIGHSVTSPLLFGIRTEGQLGGRTELLEALAIFQSTYIKSRQKTIEKQINKIAKWGGVEEDIVLSTYTIDFSTIENI